MRWILPLLAAAPCVVHAQAPVRYRMVATLPGSLALGATSSRPLTEARTTSIVSVAPQDSAGVLLLRLIVDSSRTEQIPVDSSAEAVAAAERSRATMAAAAASVAADPARAGLPTVHRIEMQRGRAVNISTGRGTSPKPAALDSLNPYASLLNRLPGLALLVPDAKVPVVRGEKVTDTLVTHTRTAGGTMTPFGGGTPTSLPGVETWDTTITTWTRRTSDTLEARVTRRTTRTTESRPSTSMTDGTYRVVMDGSHVIREILVTLRGASPNGDVATTRTSSYLLTRIP